MCRFMVIVIFVSCASFGVLAQGIETTTPKLKLDCANDTEVIAKRQEWHKCFSNTVERHLKPNGSITGDCQTVNGFEEKLDDFIKFLHKKCGIQIRFSTKPLIKLIKFSLKDNSFEKFYKDIECVKQAEYNISNSCVKTNVGFFNVTTKKKHTSWSAKLHLQYNWETCQINKKVDNCVQTVLHDCNQHTVEYMANLFNYTRELGNCSSFNDTQIYGAATASWLTTPICLLAVLMHVCVQKLKVG